jgi:death on curing protein
MYSRYGGTFFGLDNLKFPGKLDWVLDAIHYPIFDSELYPTIIEKAAILGWKIGAEHVFHDGNKRTSTYSVLFFLRSNGFDLNATNSELFDIALKLSTSKKSNFSLDDYKIWLENHIVIKRGNNPFNLLMV